MSTATERDYVLGTHDEELRRLGLQHAVWRSRASDAWIRAGFTSGQTIIDLGCGPGYASFDLANVVGASGCVLALDRSSRFLDNVRNAGIPQIEVHEVDLDRDDLPRATADGAWARWVFAFLQRPRDLVRSVASALRPGGVLVAHEYLQYDTWRFLPGSPVFERFVQTVKRGWRASGGEPDIGRELPSWLDESGFEIVSLRPLVDVIDQSSFIWQWPKTFIEVGLERLRSIDVMTEAEVAEVRSEVARLEATPGIRMVTPMVVEIIARKRQLH